MQTQPRIANSLPGYQELIREVTEAPLSALGIIENIMRDEVFHSTLDWQSRELFAEGARKAYAIFLDDPVFHYRLARAQSLRFRIGEWERRLIKARKRGSSKTIERLETQLRFARRDLEAIESPVARISAANPD